ncbi:hypothetical protein AF335_22940 [Streptomyces eurocidicus]|uniref:Sigma-like protein n=1 Tax=Streptomyces eurocidicus TaxID=66423 RepID=A0A2N8NSG8_STREU|nr:hypothetical protein [Streptomyces eurocidicus]MBB5121632.1 hypothetical protein [Streptomyces eurocidicus]MBF6054724.1 hypothetical protein [Streptomyces eurocidicus]PNE31713.1 hypothetical protein AF335_22940 [Streptomyces eurocidicus]
MSDEKLLRPGVVTTPQDDHAGGATLAAPQHVLADDHAGSPKPLLAPMDDHAGSPKPLVAPMDDHAGSPTPLDVLQDDHAGSEPA